MMIIIIIVKTNLIEYESGEKIYYQTKYANIMHKEKKKNFFFFFIIQLWIS
jgi:hypothetical protein